MFLLKRPFALVGALSLVSALACTSSSRKPRAGSRPGVCKVELWSVSWNTDGVAALDEDALSASPLTRRYQSQDCNYVAELRRWMDHMTPLASAPPGVGDLRLLARVTTGASSWLLAVPITCNWLRLDYTRFYRLDPGLFALLARPLPDDEREAIQRFGACGL